MPFPCVRIQIGCLGKDLRDACGRLAPGTGVGFDPGGFHPWRWGQPCQFTVLWGGLLILLAHEWVHVAKQG